MIGGVNAVFSFYYLCLKYVKRMVGKRILFIAPDDYKLYVPVEKNLEFLGFSVTTILRDSIKFKYKSIFQRLLNLFKKLVDRNTNYKKKLKAAYTSESLVREIDGYECFDYCLVFRADYFSKEVLDKAREKSSFMVSYHYDGLKRNPSIYRRIPVFDRFYVFDEEDIINDGKIQTFLSSNFYFDYEEFTDDSKPLYDIYFLGYYAKSREELLFNFFDVAKNCLGKVRFEIRFQSENMRHLLNYESRGIQCFTGLVPFEEYLERVKQAKIIVDFVISDHKGLSFRIFEGLKFQKKVITTNVNIIKYDFYTPDNFFVLDSNNLNEEELLKFVNSPYSPIEESIRLKYSFSFWIKDILNIV